VAFETIEGQPRAVELLRRALADDRVAHAYAFIGPAGSGRTATALAFAQALICPERGCGRCKVCGMARAGQHPDIHLIVPTPPESNPKGPKAIRIGAIRELGRRASLKPALAPHKVFILDDADRMTGEAPQAFLKTLEEPPARTVLILVLDRPRAVPATVLSRCQLVRFAPRRDDRAVAERAEALEILGEVRAKGVEALFRRAGTFDRDRERAERVVDAYWWLCRDLVLTKCGAAHLTTDADANTREAETWSWDDLWKGLATCREAREALAVNVTPRLTLEVLLSRIALRVA
jgi:DNA polymerase-3 subunit delta'